MNDDKATPFLEKAQEALRAAQILLEQGCLNSAANRAYYAAFHSARAAIVAAGISAMDHRWSHDALQGGFSQLIRRRKVYPARIRAYLEELRSVRGLADYGLEMVSLRMVRAAVHKADELVTLVAKELIQ